MEEGSTQRSIILFLLIVMAILSLNAVLLQYQKPTCYTLPMETINYEPNY
jgi:hypothetical protein